MERTLPGGAFWTETATGYKYSDRTLANLGFRSATLKAANSPEKSKRRNSASS